MQYAGLTPLLYLYFTKLGLLLVLALTVLIVWYLYQNRQRLFRHHHH